MIGSEQELSVINSFLDVSFEPLIYQQLMRSWVFGLSSCAVVAIFVWAFYSTPWVFKANPMMGHALGSSAAILPVLVDMTFPIYLRIVPGRLDILRFSLFGARGRFLQSFDLKTAKVTLDCRLRRLEIIGRDGRGCRIHLNFFMKPYDVAHAVFEAAVSSHPAPPLPDDELLG